MIKIGIIGAAGYTGGELLRILVNHPQAQVAWAHSQSQASKAVATTHGDLWGDTNLVFSGGEVAPLLAEQDLSVIFLCSGHQQSKKFLTENAIPETVKIIDLSTDFRNQEAGFVYGLPELQRERIKTAQRIANPGCFATCIELALLPLAQAQLLTDDAHVSAITGSTGAGQSLSDSTHFSWRNNNLSVYKAFEHQHLAEIKMSLQILQTHFDKNINFIPYRGDFTRGIMANVYTRFDGTLTEAVELYETYYAPHPFTHVSPQAID